MSPALLLVDVQNEFLAHDRLAPARARLLTAIGRLLAGFRRHALPVLHARYVTEESGAGQLPHHVRAGRRVCVRGSSGAAAPADAAAGDGEPVLYKHGYSAFGEPELERDLTALRPRPLVIAGLHVHSCIRATALDGLQRGLEILVASDAVGSYDPLHAHLTEVYLAERGVRFLDTDTLLEELEGSVAPAGTREAGVTYPVAGIGGRWLPAGNEASSEQRNPSRWSEVLGRVPLASPSTVAKAVAGVATAQRGWARLAHERRLEHLRSWADAIASRAEELVGLLALEVGKPIGEGRVEVARAVETLRVFTRRFAEGPSETRTAGGTIRARRRPLGVVAAVTPWNNPVAIPVGKIGPALLFGNTVVWKPAPECPRASIALQETIWESFGPELVALVFGAAPTALELIADPRVTAVTFTGSSRAGKLVSARCAYAAKPVQAEMGGNNAAIVLADADVERAASELCHAAFDFAGQGCTATRRLVVAQAVVGPFADAFGAATRGLVIGDPAQPTTHVGPVISRGKQRAIDRLLQGARVERRELDAELVERGCWVAPTIAWADPASILVQDETFGPVAVIQIARDLSDALALANGVPQGLVTSIYTPDPSSRERFLEETHAGVLKLEQPTRGAHPDAPFGGWKESAFGPPEHSLWDLDFYTRWQAIYGAPSESP